ncbi:MAG: 50S ribosomal protein L29 [Terracidiphilus sp.]|jgi:large subunit ribosomal protein L29
MELTKIRNLSDEELKHQEKTSSEQLFRIRFQVALGQNDGVKKLRQLRKEIAQIKTVARERELGIRGEIGEGEPAAPAAESRAAKTEDAAPAAEAKHAKAKKHVAPATAKTAKVKKAAPVAKAKTGKTKKTAASAKKKTGKAKGASK